MPVNFLRQGGVGGILFYKSFDIVGGKFQMLDPVFAKVSAAEADNLFYHIKVGGFCNNDEGYLGPDAVASGAGRVNAVTNLFQIVGNFIHSIYPTKNFTAGILPDF
jgi:hypothetical protein